MTPHDITKALEIWTLQNLLNISIMFGLLALGLSVCQSYYKSLENYLTLRVSIEIWNVVTTLLVDVLLIIVVLVGYLVLNPDIMADIKMAIPFVPIATILFSISLFLRLFNGGHQVSNPKFFRSLWYMLAANIINIIGFTFVMEAPSSAYLERHPNACWTNSRPQTSGWIHLYGIPQPRWQRWHEKYPGNHHHCAMRRRAGKGYRG